MKRPRRTGCRDCIPMIIVPSRAAALFFCAMRQRGVVPELVANDEANNIRHRPAIAQSRMIHKDADIGEAFQYPYLDHYDAVRKSGGRTPWN